MGGISAQKNTLSQFGMLAGFDAATSSSVVKASLMLMVQLSMSSLIYSGNNRKNMSEAASK